MKMTESGTYLYYSTIKIKLKLVRLGKIGSQSPPTYIAQVNAFIVLRIKFLFFEVFFCSFLSSANDARWMKAYNSHWRLEFKFDKIIHSSILFLIYWGLWLLVVIDISKILCIVYILKMMYLRTHTHMHARTHSHALICIYIYIYIYIYICTRTRLS